MKNKNVLLATIGTSPQVVTESLYALARDNAAWPDAVFLITTSVGKNKLLQLDFVQHLQRLCDELQRPVPAFDEAHILVTPDAAGAAVEDARSLADHQALANFIMTQVRNCTSDPSVCLHASLAGGRKTMTFYIGYAMSLFGRHKDTLSHVLVSDGYEGNPNFWYPTQHEAYRHIQTREGLTLDAQAAEVTLAPIPFIRHRHNLPHVLLQAGETVNFAELVQLINLGENPQEIQLEIHPADRSITLSDGRTTMLSFELTLLDFAYYLMMARATVDGESDFLRPNKSKPDKGLSATLLEHLMPLCGLRQSHNLRQDLEALSAWNDMRNQLRNRSIESLQEGMTESWFDSRLSSLKNTFEQKLPLSMVRWVLPTIIWHEDGIRLVSSDVDSTKRGSGYGIFLESKQIHIHAV